MSREFIPSPDQQQLLAFAGERARCGWWAAMGTGKTSAALSLIDALHSAGMESKPALVLAPLRVANSSWPDEAKKWSRFRHLDVVPITGSDRDRSAGLANARNGHAPIYTMNYENLQWLMERLDGGSWPFGMVVADESTRLKSFRFGGSKGRRARAIAAVAHKHCTRWLNLTGTPSPNGLQDLWGQTWFLDAGQRLGRIYTAFEQRWFRTGHNGFGLKALPHAQAEIEALLADIYITVQPKDLDQPIIKPVRVRLPSRARSAYQEMERTLFTMLSGGVEIEAPNFGVAMGKCLQIASGAVYIDDEKNWQELHDAKVQALESIVAEASGAPVLVSYHFRHSLARLMKAFPKGRALDTNPQTIRDWNAGKVPLLFAHPASAGHGLNLQDGGNILAFFDHTWNLEEYQQIVERIGPMRQKQSGHNRPVFLYPIVAEDTFDEDVMHRREGKAEVQTLLLDAMKRRGGVGG
jgi:SNF2 family DNA or RNA helicase